MTDTAPRLGLRERKKQRTHDDLERIALRLFVERGYDHVTVEEIAAAADVSHRTFYRYFASKEDLVLGDLAAFAELLEEALIARPADEPILTSIAEVTVELATLMAGDPLDLVTRSEIVEANPILRQRSIERRPHLEEALLSPVASRLDRAPDDPFVRLFVACVVAATRTAVDRWIAEGSMTPLMPIIEEALGLLDGGFGDHLRPPT